MTGDDSLHTLRRPPWSLRILCLVVVGTGVYNLLLALDNGQNAGRYRDLGVSYPVALRVLTALGWGVILLAAGIGLWRRTPHARRWTLLALSNYGAFGVLWKVAYAQSDFSRDRLAFQAALATALVAAVAWVLNRKRVRAAFRTSISGPGSQQPVFDVSLERERDDTQRTSN